jgi:hypothetical protein
MVPEAVHTTQNERAFVTITIPTKVDVVQNRQRIDLPLSGLQIDPPYFDAVGLERMVKDSYVLTHERRIVRNKFNRRWTRDSANGCLSAYRDPSGHLLSNRKDWWNCGSGDCLKRMANCDR